MTVQVTVATINLHNRADRWRERRHLLIGQIVETVPDLLSMQEVHRSIRQGHWICEQVNYRLSGSEKMPYQLIQKWGQNPLNSAAKGVAVLSRLPVLYHESVSLGHGGRVALRVHVELPSHKTMDFVTTQFHHLPYEKEARQEQAMRLMGWLNSYKHVPIQVIAGDFNESPDGLAIAYIKQSFRSAYEQWVGREPLATYPTSLVAGHTLATCLDYIFFSPAVQRVTAASLFCKKADREDKTLYPSDHVGLLAILEV